MTDTAGALADLREALADARFPLALDDAPPAARAAHAAVRQIDDYVLPRLAHLEAPLLVVVGGSTGAGKSTLVNSLVGRSVSEAGAIRPTTRQPVLLTAPGDIEWFANDRVLPGLRRTSGPGTASADADALALLSSPAIPRDLALLDAPDIDSIADQNRALSRQLLDAADLWLFVTTANRYADAAAWDLLDQAAARGVTVGVVLDRVPPGAAEAIHDDLRVMLRDHGLDEAPIFVLEESPLDAEGLLPDVSAIRGWLEELSGDRARRLGIARQTVAGAVSGLTDSSLTIADALENQETAAQELSDVITSHYDRGVEAVMDTTTDGTLLRGEVLARWQDFVGTSDVFRTVETWFGGIRDRVTGWFSGKPAPITQVEAEIETGLAAVIIDEAGKAASSTWDHLRRGGAGRELFTTPALAHESAEVAEEATSLVRAWQADLLNLVRQESPGKRRQARLVSLGLNTVTVSLMIVVFASTGGLVGGELAIAGGSAVVGQKLLETVFGDQAVRKLARQGEDLLRERTQKLFDRESSRYRAVLAQTHGGTSSAALRELAATVREANA